MNRVKPALYHELLITIDKLPSMKLGPPETSGPSLIILRVLLKLAPSSNCMLNNAAGRQNFFFWIPDGELIHSR